MIKTYYNLTNGIEFISVWNTYRFVRIQSSLCESKKWDKIIYELDYNFLMDIALGNRVIVIDGSNKKKQSKAMYQGIPWIVYVLNRKWNLGEKEAFVKENNVTEYFRKQYKKLSDCTKNKLHYFNKFVMTEKINLEGTTYSTIHDSDYNFYRNKLKGVK